MRGLPLPRWSGGAGGNPLRADAPAPVFWDPPPAPHHQPPSPLCSNPHPSISDPTITIDSLCFVALARKIKMKIQTKHILPDDDSNHHSYTGSLFIKEFEAQFHKSASLPWPLQSAPLKYYLLPFREHHGQPLLCKR